MTVHVRGCHLGPPQISQKLLICAQSLSCLCQCSQAMGQRMGSEFLCQRKNFHLPKQCSEKCNAEHRQWAALTSWNLKNQIKMFTRVSTSIPSWRTIWVWRLSWMLSAKYIGHGPHFRMGNQIVGWRISFQPRTRDSQVWIQGYMEGLIYILNVEAEAKYTESKEKQKWFYNAKYGKCWENILKNSHFGLTCHPVIPL